MTTPDPRLQIASAILEVMARHARNDMLDVDAFRSATDDITHVFADAGLVDGTGLENLSDDAAEALARLKTVSPEDLARLLRKLAELAEDRKKAPQSLEDLANWFERNLGPILSRRFGIEAEQDTKDRIREGARSIVESALAKRGIAPVTPAPRERTAPDGISRHRLFWQNFASLAPGLSRMVRASGGAEAAARQVSGLLDALDLPHDVTVSAVPCGAQLDFAATDDVATATLLQTILADAPAIDGWRISVGGHSV